MNQTKKIKVALITFHFVNNFGGALQAYALQEAIEKECKAEAQIIDYRNGFIEFTDFVRLFPVTKNRDEIRSGLATMRERFGRVRRFQSFRNKKMHCTKRPYHHIHLKLHAPEADAYICGSDQIWNPFLTLGVKGAYYLDFVDAGRKRIAYAPSFGKSRLHSIFSKKMKRHLEQMDAISVRETTGVRIVEELLGEKPEKLIDPTFLLTREEWEQAAAEIERKEPYMLLYIMQSDRAMYDCARGLKERLGLRVVEISRYGFNPGFIDETLVDVGPAEFLGLIKNAAYVCTNSYHGFIFSLLFEKPFFLVPCKRFRTRIYNLADMLSIELDTEEGQEIVETRYDPTRVREQIAKEREKALSWLNRELGNEMRIGACND